MRIVTLGDICELKYGKALKKEKREPGSVPVYGSNGIVGYHNKDLIQHETIIVGRKGSVGALHFEKGASWPIDTTYFISLNKDIQIIPPRHIFAQRLPRGQKLAQAFKRTAKIPPFAGQKTTEETLGIAEAFYGAMDRVVIRVRKEVVGHLANRLTAALYREAVCLVADGVGTVEDVDRAIAHGPGMRWALMGPHMIYHLGGGESGYRGYLEHLGQTHPRSTIHLFHKHPCCYR